MLSQRLCLSSDARSPIPLRQAEEAAKLAAQQEAKAMRRRAEELEVRKNLRAFRSLLSQRVCLPACLPWALPAPAPPTQLKLCNPLPGTAGQPERGGVGQVAQRGGIRIQPGVVRCGAGSHKLQSQVRVDLH